MYRDEDCEIPDFNVKLETFMRGASAVVDVPRSASRDVACGCPYCQGPHAEVCQPSWGPPKPSHSEIYTKADTSPEFFDDTVLGPTPNDHQYGYCFDCHAPFRWSVDAQQWEQITKEELRADYEVWCQSVRDDAGAFLKELREGG